MHSLTFSFVKLTININDGMSKYAKSFLSILMFLKLRSYDNSLEVYNNFE